MAQENYSDLFDFQGTDKEKEELKSYVEGLFELPTGKKILEKAKNCSIKKPIPLFYKEDDCEWGGAGAVYEKGFIFIQPKMKLENFPEELRDEKKKKLISLLGHEILHLTQEGLNAIRKQPLNTLQKIYLELLMEGETYATEEILQSELNHQEIPSYQQKMTSFITGKQLEDANSKKISMLYTPHYIDSGIKFEKKRMLANRPLSNEEFNGQVKDALGNPEWIDDISYDKCGWIHPRPLGGTYVHGNRCMTWLDKDNAPIYTCIYDKGQFIFYVYSSKTEQKDTNFKTHSIIVSNHFTRPLFDSEIMNIRKCIDNSVEIPSDCVKEDIKPPKEIRTLDQFISWQNQEQQKTLESIQKKRQNPRR